MKPTDQPLYDSVKRRIYRENPKHSAYRSGRLVQAYKAAFKKKHGTKQPYKGDKRKAPLKRWFKEKWRNQRGGIGYKSKSDVYRPTIRVSKKTPTTFKELSPSQIRAARREKEATGRVNKFGGNIKVSTRKHKKYMTKHGSRTYHWGDKRYTQFKDQTGLGVYSKQNNNSLARRKAFLLRHTGKSTKKAALAEARRRGHIPLIMSIRYLW